MNEPSSESLVLVDSSVWIDFFQGPRGTDKNNELRSLLEENFVAINPVIRLEILTGATSEDKFQDLGTYLQDLPSFAINDGVYCQAEEIRFRSRKYGQTIPVPDVLIAATAICYESPLLQRDDHFNVIQQQFETLSFYQK